MKGIKFTDEHKKNIKTNHHDVRGKNNPNWKGGISPEYHIIRTSNEYKEWRLAVYKRDNFTCVWCGNNKSGQLTADHIKPFAIFPELRLEVSNGQTLCKKCHIEKTKQDWNIYFSKVRIISNGI